MGLIRLQETYQLDTKSLANGAIGDSCCAPELSVEDCFELGRQSYNAKNYDYAIQWLTEALLRLPAGELNQVPPDDMHNSSLSFSNETVSPPPKRQKPKRASTVPPSRVSKEEILSYLHWAEEIKKTLDLGKDFLSQLTGFQLDAFVEQVAQVVAGPGQHDDGLSQKELGDRYKALCRGDHPGGRSSSSVNPNLKCYYCTRGNNPYYLVGPIKAELINLDPPMWSFKKVIHPGEIERLKDLARPRVKYELLEFKKLNMGGIFKNNSLFVFIQFETAMIVNVMTGVNERSNSRISKSAWLAKQDDPVVHRIDKRTGILTGLSMDSAELLQIANYGIGGMYLPHYDFALPGQSASFLAEDRNRISTMLFYMSDVEKGGATVFPKLNLTLWPEKGSAVFWYNLKKSGDGDLRTQHAACPVLVGSKWGKIFIFFKM